MTLAELKESLSSAGFTPLCVVNEPAQDDDRLKIDGGLSEYLEALRAVGAKTILVYSLVFGEDYFLYIPNAVDNDSEEVGETDGDPIDLRVANGALNKYKQFVGQTAMFRLSTQVQADYLDLVIEQRRWREFLTERNQTTDELDDAREQRLAAENARAEAKRTS